MKKKHIPIVDLFAGPGGLGEGFSSVCNGNAFKIVVSAEMESSAHKTLLLRSFYRILKRNGSDALQSYYKFCNDGAIDEQDEIAKKCWKMASEEALQLTLGKPEDNLKLDEILKNSGLNSTKPWVLIGGPPCQAYSIVGRSRNQGKQNYLAVNNQRRSES